MRTAAEMYGIYDVIRMDFFAPASCCDTSPSLTYVAVEAGLCVTVEAAPVRMVVETAVLSA